MELSQALLVFNEIGDFKFSKPDYKSKFSESF